MNEDTKTYCNCCGNELTEGDKLNTCLYFTIITAKAKGRANYCCECGIRILIKANEELEKIRKEKGIKLDSFIW